MSSSFQTNWDINVNSVKHPHPIPDPYGFNISFVETIDPKIKLKEVATVKANVSIYNNQFQI